MKCTIFPPLMKKRMQSELNAHLVEIEKKRTELRSRAQPSSSIMWLLGGTLGAMGALWGCVNAFFSCNDAGGPMITGALIGLAAGVALGYIYILYSAKAKNALKPEELNAALSVLDDEEKEIKEKARIAYNNYCREFERQVVAVQSKLSLGDTPTRYAEALLPSFERFISNIDRSRHLKNLNAALMFYVENTKLTVPWDNGNDDVYSFEENRNANLTDAVQVVAVGKLVANNIRLLLQMKYPQDVSGSNYVVDFKEEYLEDKFKVTMVYTAPNGFYEEVKGW